MKSEHQEAQEQLNKIRLQAYRDKLTPVQRRRADMAKKVQYYAKQHDLSLAQTSEVIRLTLSMITLGFTDDKAFKTGALAVDIMVRINNAHHLPLRRLDTLH